MDSRKRNASPRSVSSSGGKKSRTSSNSSAGVQHVAHGSTNPPRPGGTRGPQKSQMPPKPSKARVPQKGGSRGGKRKGKAHRHHFVRWMLLAILALILAGVAAFVYLYISIDVPAPEKMAMAEKTQVYYADGTTEMGTFAEQNREIISCDALPKYIGQSIVASENQSFYQDKGIDLKGIARAFVNNVTGGARQGGSTITQQYAERYYIGDTHTYKGKVQEAILALKINRTQSKDEVLCNYMNTIYLGRGAYGIQAAAKAYYNKDAKDLTLPEAAMLAGIIPSPTNWDPSVDPKMAQKRYERVISIMGNEGELSKDDKAAAKTLPQVAPPQDQPNWYAGPQGYLLQMVRDELTGTKAFTKSDLDTGGYKIVTTIDKNKQDIMFNVASPSQGGQGIVPPGVQVGGMSVNPKDGSIQSVYAGDDYLAKQFNNATQAKYEPGSTMKPFALMATIQAGVNLNTTFNGNSPRTFENITQPVQNFGNEQFGYTNLYNATANSINTIYMDLQQHLGAKTVAETAQEAGISPKLVDGSNPFTVLGNDGVHISDMAQAYATLANQGNKPTVHIVSSVKDQNGKDMYRAPTATEQVFKANDAALVTKAMTGTVQYGTATEAKRIGKAVAGKSGTANDNTAGSFAGYTPNTVAVFATWNPDANGNPQPMPTFAGYTGGSDYPVHLFTEYMRRALANTPNEAFPVARDNGKIGGPDGSWGSGYGSSSTWGNSKRGYNSYNSYNSYGYGSTGSYGYRKSYNSYNNTGTTQKQSTTPTPSTPAPAPTQTQTPAQPTPSAQPNQSGGTQNSSGH